MNLLQADQHLPVMPSKPKQDAHPKGPNPHLAIANKKFQNVQLSVWCADDSAVTADMLERGPKAMQDDEIREWIAEISAKRYQIIVAGQEPLPAERRVVDGEDVDEPADVHESNNNAADNGSL